MVNRLIFHVSSLHFLCISPVIFNKHMLLEALRTQHVTSSSPVYPSFSTKPCDWSRLELSTQNCAPTQTNTSPKVFYSMLKNGYYAKSAFHGFLFRYCGVPSLDAYLEFCFASFLYSLNSPR